MLDNKKKQTIDTSKNMGLINIEVPRQLLLGSGYIGETKNKQQIMSSLGKVIKAYFTLKIIIQINNLLNSVFSISFLISKNNFKYMQL